MNNFTINNLYNLKIPREGESFTPLAPKRVKGEIKLRIWSQKEIKLLSKVDEYTQSYFANKKNVNDAEIFAFSANLFNCNTKKNARTLHAIGEKRRYLLSINDPLLKTNLIEFVDSRPTPQEAAESQDQLPEQQKRKREHTYNEGTTVARKKIYERTTPKQLQTIAHLHTLYPKMPWSCKRIIFNNIFCTDFSRAKLYNVWQNISAEKLTSLLSKSLIRKGRAVLDWNYSDAIQLLYFKSTELPWDEIALLFNANNGTAFSPSFFEQRFTEINAGLDQEEEAQLPEWNSDHDRELIELYSKGFEWDIIADHFNTAYRFTISPQYVKGHFQAITGYQSV